MARTPEQSTVWAASFLKGKGGILDAEVTGAQTLQISREEFEPFTAGIVSTPRVTPELVQPFVGLSRGIEIIANIPKESMWNGPAIELARINSIAFGGLGDLMSATSDEDVTQYVRSEFQFVERGLSQHDQVDRLERVHDRLYIVHRNTMSPVRFVMLNAYELTGDHIRTARDRYGAFDNVLLNNPNGRATTDAIAVERALNVRILKWGHFLGRLNSR